MTAPLTPAEFVAASRSAKANKLASAWVALLMRHGGRADTAASVKLFDSLTDGQFFRLWRDHARIHVPSQATVAQARAILVARLPVVERVVLLMPPDGGGDHAEAEVYEARERMAPDDAAVVATHDLAGGER